MRSHPPCVSALLLPFLLLAQPQSQRRLAEQSLISRDYASAARLLDRELAAALENEQAEGQDRLLFLLANARLLGGDLARAEGDFERLERDYPSSRYRFLASYGKARCRAGASRFQEAADLYRTQVARLLSAERRKRLAEVYTGLAQKALAKDPVDYKGAISFLDLAVGLELPRQKAQELGLRAAKLAFEGKDYKGAVARFRGLVLELRGRVFEPVPGRPAWNERLWLARAWRRAGQIPEARRLLEDLLREGIPGEQAPSARYELALCFGVPKRGPVAARGVDELQRFLGAWPKHAKAPEVAYLLATSQANLGRLEEALETLALLIERYASSEQAADAMADRGLYLGRLERFDEAIAAWKTYLSSFPSHGKWMLAQRAIVELELAKADTLKREGKSKYAGAAELYEAFLRSHPLHKRAPGIHLTLGKMQEELEQYENARQLFERCAGKYPGSREASESAYRVGFLLESKLFNYPAALEAYRKVKGPFRGQALARLRVLEEKSLTLRTERVFRTDEKARVELVSRNIPKLRVRVYKLDLETFFRGTIGTGNIESLAIEVISPDASFDSEVKAYLPHKETEREIQVPFQGPGAYVVKVDDQELEASTLLLVSDLALITKSSRKELFVFAEDTRQGRAMPGARVVVTDGARILGEGETDARGSYRASGKAVEQAQHLYVFATAKDGSAATTLDLSGLSLSAGLTSKCFLYTDRGLYRPGDRLRAKAILRDVAQGVYVIPKEKDYELDLLDGSSRLLASRSLELNEFGTLAAGFGVPAGASPGSFSLALRRKSDGRVLGTTAVKVDRFTRPRVSIELASERTVLVRGEKIQGRVKARYFFGGPVSGKRVEVSATIAGHSRVLRGVTDEAGEFPFSFESQALASGVTVFVQCTIPEEQASTRDVFRVESTGFRLRTELPSPIYLVGEDLEAKVIAEGHDGKKLGRSLTMALFRLETLRGALSELPAGERKVTTDAKTGVAFGHFKLDKGGKYRLRVFGPDRFENRIETSRDFFVSGKEDKVKLRILSATQHGRVGDKLALRIVNRAAPRLCLVTTEGDGILDFETRVFPKGESKLELPLSELHAPNFALGLSMVDGKLFHTARKAFLVSRPLVVEIDKASERVKPGGKLELGLRVRDSRGRPVEAEFSLAAVDEALLDLEPDRSPDLYRVFYGVRRSTELRTSSSCTFAYLGSTRRVNAEIRAEERDRRRRELEKKEKALWAKLARDGSDGYLRARLARTAADEPAQTKYLALEEEAESEMDEKAFNDAIGLGGGAGGSYGGRRSRRGQGQIAGQQLLYLGAVDKAMQPAPGFEAFGQTMLGIEVAGEQEQQKPDWRALSVWRAEVRTDATGAGKVELVLPPKPGRWQIRLRGISKDSLVGEASTSVVTADELLLQAVLPASLTEGDAPGGRLVVHNTGDDEKQLSVRVSIDGKPGPGIERKVEGGRRHEAELEFPTREVGVHELVCAASSKGGDKAKEMQSIEVLPWGLEERVARSGLGSGAYELRLALPEGREYRSRSLVIDLGPELIEELLPAAGIRRRTQLNLNSSLCECEIPTHANRAARGLAALAFYRHRASGRPGEKGVLARLRASIEASVAELESLEKGGEVSWIGRSKGDVRASLLSWLFLERARQAGFAVDEKVLARFRGKLPAWLRNRNLDLAALAFLVSAEARRSDFTRFNSLYRARRAMGLGGLGMLCLAAHAMERPELAEGIRPELAKKLEALLGRGSGAPDVKLRPAPVDLEGALWGFLALSRARGYGALLERAESWIHARRRPWGWSNGMVTALAIDFFGGRKRSRLAARVTVKVNGRFEKSVDFRADPSHRRIVVPLENLADGENRITIATSGRGRVVWSALLTGLTKGLPEERLGSRFLTRSYLQAPEVADGEVIPEGFTKVDSKLKRWENKATSVRVGGSIKVKLRYAPSSRLRESIGSFMVEEPLPAGAVVLPSEVSGTYDHLEIGTGFLRFYGHKRRGWFQAQYTLRGFLPGRYRVLPTRLYSLDRPGRDLHAKPAEIRVLGPGEKSPDERRATPDELYARGVKLFDRLSRDDLLNNVAARDAAEAHLNRLYEDFGEHLREAAFREVARRLLRISLAKRDAARTVKLFEALMDRDEDYVLGFEEMARVGESYYESGEFEQALNVYKAIAETSFLKEVQIAGTLDRLGELKTSVSFMEELFLAFPGLPTVRHALYSLAQSLNLKAAKGMKFEKGTPLELRRKARDLCYEFLLRWPDDADADEVAFTLASIALEAEQLDEALALLVRAQQAHQDSTWLDDFLYLEGYAWFLKAEQDKALARLKRVAEEDFPLGKGRRGKSDSRWLATFLQGQIHHAAGRPATALAMYEKIQSRFTEAREAAVFFTERRLELPEVTVIKPSAPSALELSYRNLSSADITVYKVDLMRLYLLRKSLSDMGKVQLFGIAPIHSEKIDLDGAKYRDQKHELSLPMQEPGAYLVLARSGELRSSGLMLRTELSIEAQEMREQSRIRVNVKRGDRFLSKATVKVVGDRDGRIRSGKTDLRGIFVADELQGHATVLVKADESYAFYRGKVSFGSAPNKARAGLKRQRKRPASKRKLFDALEQNDARNLQLQQRALKRIDQLYKNTQKGVEIRRTK